MPKYIRPKYEDKDLGTNPFVQNLIVKVNILEKNNLYEMDEEGIKDNVEVQLEADRCTKFYHNKEKREVITKLTDKAQRLFLWLLSAIVTNKDEVWINRERYAEENEIKSRVTISNAIKELHRCDIICPTPVKGIYWINPDYIFSGSRVNTFKKNVRLGSKFKEKKKESIWTDV